MDISIGDEKVNPQRKNELSESNKVKLQPSPNTLDLWHLQSNLWLQVGNNQFLESSIDYWNDHQGSDATTLIIQHQTVYLFSRSNGRSILHYSICLVFCFSCYLTFIITLRYFDNNFNYACVAELLRSRLLQKLW